MCYLQNVGGIFTRFGEQHARFLNEEHSLPFKGNYCSPQSGLALEINEMESGWRRSYPNIRRYFNFASRAPSRRSGSPVEGINWEKEENLRNGWLLRRLVWLCVNKTRPGRRPRYSRPQILLGHVSLDYTWICAWWHLAGLKFGCSVRFYWCPPPHHHRRLVTGSRHQRWRGDLPSAGDTAAGGAEPQQKNHRRFLDSKESDGSVIVVIFLPWVAVFLRYADSLKLNFTSLQRWGSAFFPWALWTNVVDDDRDMQAWDNGGGNNRGRHLCFRLFHHAPWFWSFSAVGGSGSRSLAVLWSKAFHLSSRWWTLMDTPASCFLSGTRRLSSLHQTIIANRYLKQICRLNYKGLLSKALVLGACFHSKCYNNETGVGQTAQIWLQKDLFRVCHPWNNDAGFQMMAEKLNPNYTSISVM